MKPASESNAQRADDPSRQRGPAPYAKSILLRVQSVAESRYQGHEKAGVNSAVLSTCLQAGSHSVWLQSVQTGT